MNLISAVNISTPSRSSRASESSISLVIAVSLIGSWMCHLGFWLSRDLSTVPWLIGIGGFWIQVFFNTGLFITAHDAMHGLVYPKKQAVNRAFGVLCSTLYAFLPYGTLATNHQLHHQFPMSSADPDFSEHENVSFILCYLQFIGQYWGWKPFIQLTGMVGCLLGLLNRPLAK